MKVLRHLWTEIRWFPSRWTGRLLLALLGFFMLAYDLDSWSDDSRKALHYLCELGVITAFGGWIHGVEKRIPRGRNYNRE